MKVFLGVKVRSAESNPPPGVSVQMESVFRSSPLPLAQKPWTLT